MRNEEITGPAAPPPGALGVTRPAAEPLAQRRRGMRIPQRVGPLMETDTMLPHNLIPQTATMDRTAWAADLVPGHIVAMTIPSRGRRRPDPEPHVVLDTVEYGGEPAAVLAPALPAAGGQARRDDVYLTADDLTGVRGLHGPHMCLTGRRLIVPPTHRGLAEAAFDDTPVPGLLARPAQRRVYRLRGRLGVGRALAEQRRHGRYLAGREAVRGEDFTVATRRSAPPAPRAIATPQTQGTEKGRA